MAQCVVTKIWHRTTLLDDNIVVGILAFGNEVVGDIWDLEQFVGHVGLGLVHDLLQCLVSSLQLCNLSLDFLGLVLLAVLHQAADLFRQLILVLLVAVKLLLALAAQLVILQYFFNSFTGSGEMLLLQALDHAFSFLTDEFKCKHIAVY